MNFDITNFQTLAAPRKIATLASLALFVGMVAIWAQVIATLWVIVTANPPPTSVVDRVDLLPVNFPVSREFGAETSRAVTGLELPSQAQWANVEAQ
jgi:hypothetical protein